MKEKYRSLFPRDQDMSEMNENTIASVEQLLTKYELLVYSSAFQEQGYDSLSQPQSITEIELQELINAVGMVAGHVARLRRAVNLPLQAAASTLPNASSGTRHSSMNTSRSSGFNAGARSPAQCNVAEGDAAAAASEDAANSPSPSAFGPPCCSTCCACSAVPSPNDPACASIGPLSASCGFAAHSQNVCINIQHIFIQQPLQLYMLYTSLYM